MDPTTAPQALALLATFLATDTHYLSSSAAYGDGGRPALERALALFLSRPELGFVWLAFARDGDAEIAAGACVVCHAVSTSRGSLVAKLDDVNVHPDWLGRGIGTAMLQALAAELARAGVTRIDSACHRDNRGAWRFYERMGFRPLDEERIALLIG